MRITKLSDEAVLAALSSLAGRERRGIVQILIFLGEVEERRLHLDLAYSSMYDFCVRKLAFSEGEARRRITGARLIRRYPQIRAELSSGAISLTNLALVATHIKDENVDRLLAELRGKTKKEVERLVASLAPRPDVPDTVQPIAPGSASMMFVIPPGLPFRPALMALSADRFQVTFTASTAQLTKIERARGLTRHKNPTGDLATLVEEALDLLIAKQEKQKFGKTTRPRSSTGPADPGDVSHATLREISERDAEQCTYVAADGARCPAREFLEVDHEHARALGGSGDAANVRLRCRAHNQRAAEQTFGRKHIERKRRLRRRRRHALELTTVDATPTPMPDEPETAASERAAPPGEAADGAEPSTSDGTPPSPREQLRYALVHLGFRAREADDALRKMNAADWKQPMDTLVREALSLLS